MTRRLACSRVLLMARLCRLQKRPAGRGPRTLSTKAISSSPARSSRRRSSSIAARCSPTRGWAARLQLAHAYASTGDGPNALREYVRAADLMPENNDAQIKAGTFMLLAGQFKDAQGLAERMLSAIANDVEAQVLLANALAGLKDSKAPSRRSRKPSSWTPALERPTRSSARCSWSRAIATPPRRHSRRRSRSIRSRPARTSSSRQLPAGRPAMPGGRTGNPARARVRAEATWSPTAPWRCIT